MNYPVHPEDRQRVSGAINTGALSKYHVEKLAQIVANDRNTIDELRRAREELWDALSRRTNEAEDMARIAEERREACKAAHDEVVAARHTIRDANRELAAMRKALAETQRQLEDQTKSWERVVKQQADENAALFRQLMDQGGLIEKLQGHLSEGAQP